MPYMTVIIPQVTNEHKDRLLGAWPAISKEMTALPSVLGVSGGQIVAQDGAAVTDFKFLQTIGMHPLPQIRLLLIRTSICNTGGRKSVRNFRLGTSTKSKIRGSGGWSTSRGDVQSRRLS